MLAKLVPHASSAAVDLMCKMLVYDPSKRTNAREALRHEYFREIRELEEAANQVVPEAVYAKLILHSFDYIAF